MNLGAFAVAASTGRTLNDFDGLGRAQPLIGLAMVIFLLSLVGSKRTGNTPCADQPGIH
jgi:NADH-quinone oxidoreductase subunit N